MHQLRPWHYLVEGASFTACGKPKRKVFNYTNLAPNVTCTGCTRTDQYLAQSMENALLGPPKPCARCNNSGLHPVQEPSRLIRLCDRCGGTGKEPTT